MPRAAVLGSPIAHSKSPLLHMAAYRALGLPWTYDRHEVDEQGLVPFLAEHGGEYAGLSLTMPLKAKACELAEVLDDAARATNAVNTLVFGEHLRGSNTDVVGFREALRAAHVPPAAEATVLGTGATARSAAYALLMDGVETLHVVGRRPAALQAFEQWLAAFPVEVRRYDWSEPVPSVPITISTTTAGATDERVVPAGPGLLFDVVYAPWPTRYAEAWQAAGGQLLSGLDLLVQQAAEQVLLMTRVDAGNRGAIVTAMYDALR